MSLARMSIAHCQDAGGTSYQTLLLFNSTKTLHLTRMTLDDYSQSDTICCNSAYIKVPVNAINTSPESSYPPCVRRLSKHCIRISLLLFVNAPPNIRWIEAYFTLYSLLIAPSRICHTRGSLAINSCTLFPPNSCLVNQRESGQSLHGHYAICVVSLDLSASGCLRCRGDSCRA